MKTSLVDQLVCSGLFTSPAVLERAASENRSARDPSRLLIPNRYNFETLCVTCRRSALLESLCFFPRGSANVAVCFRCLEALAESSLNQCARLHAPKVALLFERGDIFALLPQELVNHIATLYAQSLRR